MKKLQIQMSIFYKAVIFLYYRCNGYTTITVSEASFVTAGYTI